MKKIALFCALLGVALLVSGIAYAEVQNIKVSGDIQALGLLRDNYDLEDERNISGVGALIEQYFEDDNDALFMSVVRLRVDADLTDNVAAAVRLANVREWDNGVVDDENDISLDLAYVTLKEMLYSPLTVIIGRQELLYGNGFIVGPGQFHNPNNVKYADLSSLHGIDAVRGILDYDPWTINLLLAKIQEQDDIATITDDERNTDTDLYGVNVGYKFDKFDAEMEGYWFYKRDENYALALYDVTNVAQITFDENLVHTLGLRGSVVPMENLTLSAELAGQLGEMFDATAAAPYGEAKRDREAMLAYASGQYDFANVRFKPELGLSYLYLSGEEIGSTANRETADSGDFEAWDPMYRGKFMGSIRDALENLYATNDPADTSGWTNQHTLKLNGGLDLGELVDGLSVDAAYLHYWFAEEPIPGADDDIGDELTLSVTYDYTEDVQFLVDSAWFIPGDYYDAVHTSRIMTGGAMGIGYNSGVPAGQTGVRNRVSNDSAVSIIGSCKVTF